MFTCPRGLPFRQSEKIGDPLTDIAREGARRMLAEMGASIFKPGCPAWPRRAELVAQRYHAPDRRAAGAVDTWQRRDLSARRYVYIWTASRRLDGV